jgi:hypothetical protein
VEIGNFRKRGTAEKFGDALFKELPPSSLVVAQHQVPSTSDPSGISENGCAAVQCGKKLFWREKL